MVPVLVFQRIIYLLTKELKKEHFENEEVKNEITEKQRVEFEQKIKLITLMALTNKYCLLAPTGAKGKHEKGS